MLKERTRKRGSEIATFDRSDQSFPADRLREIFLERKVRNPKYSTRAYARDLGMSQALLSLVLNGKAPLSVKQASQIAVLLQFSFTEAQSFVESALWASPSRSKALKRAEPVDRRAKVLELELDRFKTISQWYHLALLDLSTTRGFVSEPRWIARRLRIHAVEARDAMDRLVRLGFATLENNVFRKCDKDIYFSTARSESSVRSFHTQMISKAIDELKRSERPAFEARRISGMTIAINRTRWAETKRRIIAFEKEIAEFASGGGPADEVYQFNVQMFPLTQEVE